MNASEFDDQFNRLKNQFHLAGDVNADQLAMEWFNAVKHLHVDALERAVTEIIRTARDTFFPPLGVLLETIRTRMAGSERDHNRCRTCNGCGWIESWPVMSWGLVYEMNQRCPDCGIPAPQFTKPHKSRPLTRSECDDYRELKSNRDTMPDWGKARKPLDPTAQNEIREFMTALRERLFPQHTDRYDP